MLYYGTLRGVVMLEVLSEVASLCQTIYKLKNEFKANKEQSILLCERVHSIEMTLEEIHTVTDQLLRHINQMTTILTNIHGFLMKFSKASFIKRVVKSGCYAERFKGYSEEINQTLSQITLGIAVQHLQPQPYDEADVRAANADQQIIKDNEEILLEIYRMNKYQSEYTNSELAKLLPLMEKGLYALSDKTHHDALTIIDNLERMRTELASIDDRFLVKISELDDTIKHEFSMMDHNLDRRFEVQKYDIQRIIQLEVAALKSTMLGKRNTRTFGKVDPSLFIDFDDVVLDEKPLVKHTSDFIYLAKYGGERVVVKLFLLTSQMAKNEFENEVITQSSIHSSHIVRILGICEIEGHNNQGIIVLEYMSRGHLLDYMNHFKPTDEIRLSIIKDITKGLCHIHRSNIIHADLNPGNILMNEHNEAKISDLGSSRQASISISRMMSEVESSQYAAPEYYNKSARLTHHADTYAWALLVIYIITKQEPKIGSDHLIDWKWLKSFEAHFPPSLYEMACAALHPTPTKRPKINDLDKALESVQLRPPYPTAEEYYDMARDHLKNKHETDAYNCYKRSAQKGYCKALTNLGIFKIQGTGTTQNSSEGIAYLTQAAEKKHNRACYALAELYYSGSNGVSRELEKAVYYYQQAIDNGLNTSDVTSKLTKCKRELELLRQERNAKLPLSSSSL